MASIVKWDHLPQHGEDLPEWPDWAYWRQQESRFWATRGHSISHGVIVCSSLDPDYFHVEVLNLYPPDGWSSDEVLKIAETQDMAMTHATLPADNRHYLVQRVPTVENPTAIYDLR